MAFDLGKFAGSFGQSLMSMGGGGGGQAPMGGGGMQPLDLASLMQLIPQHHIMNLLARHDQQQQQPVQHSMQHQNYLTGGY